MTGTIAEVLRLLGSRRAMAVSSTDGLDEIGNSAPTRIAEVRDGRIDMYDFDPRSVGVAPADRAALQIGSATESAAAIREVLSGRPGPRRDVVLLNAAAALLVGDAAEDWPAAMSAAARAIDTGAAADVLERWNRLEPTGMSSSSHWLWRLQPLLIAAVIGGGAWVARLRVGRVLRGAGPIPDCNSAAGAAAAPGVRAVRGVGVADADGRFRSAAAGGAAIRIWAFSQLGQYLPAPSGSRWAGCIWPCGTGVGGGHGRRGDVGRDWVDGLRAGADAGVRADGRSPHRARPVFIGLAAAAGSSWS